MYRWLKRELHLQQVWVYQSGMRRRTGVAAVARKLTYLQALYCDSYHLASSHHTPRSLQCALT